MEDLPLANEDDEDNNPDEHVVGVGEAPDHLSLRVHGANHLKDPVDAHHRKQLYVEKKSENNKYNYVYIYQKKTIQDNNKL